MYVRTLLLLTLILYSSKSADISVYRDVRLYGAKGDGITDDTQAIITALTQGRGADPNAPYPTTTYPSSTQHPALVYFPPGTYLVTQTLPVIYYTEMIGDFNNPPTIKFVSSSNTDMRVLDAMGPWFPDVNQNNFFRSIRNFVIDMTECKKCTGIHWQVSQSTALSYLHFKMSPDSQGLWMENGSGGFISDLIFEGGKHGMWVGNQQFTSRNITISNASESAIFLNWDWSWTFKNLKVFNSTAAITLGGGVGSVVVVDSVFTDCKKGVVTQFSGSQVKGTNSVLLSNLLFSTQQRESAVVVDSNNTILPAAKGVNLIDTWAQGHVWQDGKTYLRQGDFSTFTPNRPNSLAPKGKLHRRAPGDSQEYFFEKPRPHFSDVILATDLGLVGDGRTDNTNALRAAVLTSAQKEMAIYFPHGNYLLSDTVYIPPGAKLVGEAWSAFMAYGTNFEDPTNPRPLFQVGKPGEAGVAQLAGLLFTTRGPQAGAVLLEWNMHDPENQPGACGMWEVHFRIGGAISTGINEKDCPPLETAPESKCSGVWALMHITPSGSCYMENVWGWVADHDLDSHQQINVYSSRGFLCESQGPVWMYGTSFEHSTLYQYNFYGAKDIFFGMIQTETPYYQPSPTAPWNPDHASDPKYCSDDFRCHMSHALNIENSENLFMYGAGLYSFFNVWNQDCLKTTPPSCQKDLVQLLNSSKIYLYSLNTYGSLYMLTSKEDYSFAGNNSDTFCSSAILDLNYF